jgi:hypothetical protein
MTGVVLDAGALIGWDRRDRGVSKRLVEFLDRELPVLVPAGALAQAWRDGRTQVLLTRLLALDEVGVVPLDELVAREAGQLCGIRGTNDVVDASVVLCARRRGFPVMTSDPDDLRRLDPKLTLIEI